ncbi:MAG: ATP-binding cassette domain-containing protein [Microthrixaceae bacterium]
MCPAESVDPASPASRGDPVLELRGVSLRRDDTAILSGIDWTVGAGEAWVVLGANGSGKTSIAKVAAMYEHPSSGTVTVAGRQLGRCDVRELRRSVGFVSQSFATLLRGGLSALDVVMCGIHAALEPWWHRYDEDDRVRARAALGRVGVAGLAPRPFGSLSSGERQRVLIARALVTDPVLLLLDEPTAGLDIPGREQLLDDLDALAAGSTAIVLVTHHLEEIPAAFDHVLLVRDGRVAGAGAIAATLTSETLSNALAFDVDVSRRAGRWSARRASG